MSRHCSLILSIVFALGLGSSIASPVGASPADATTVATTAAVVAPGPTKQQLLEARGRTFAMSGDVARILRKIGHTDPDLAEVYLPAKSALVVVQRNLFEMGQQIGNALSLFPSLAYEAYVGQACIAAKNAVSAATGGKFLVLSQPPTSIITSNDFQAIITEVNTVRMLLGC
jgi:hypothetical protein